MSKSPTKAMRRKSVKPRTDSQITKESFLTDLGLALAFRR